MSNDRQHHPFSPSKLQSLEACCGYQSKSNSDNAASLAGTLQHSATEGGVRLDDPTLQDHEAEAVARCIDYRAALIQKYPGGTSIQEDHLAIDDVPLTLPGETQTWRGTTSGYLDFAIVDASQKVAEICDWKFGLWSVEPAETNLQGIAYLLGLVKKFPTLQSVTVHFVMPHRNEIDVHTFQAAEFPAMYLRVCTVVSNALAALRDKSEAGRRCSVGACLFCARVGECSALNAFVLKVGKKYAPAEVPANVTPSLLQSAADSSVAMSLAQLMETWAKAMRAQITARVIEDEVWMPEDYKLVSRAENSVKDWRKVIKLAKAAGVKMAAIRDAITVRMTPLNKAVMDNTPRGGKKDAAKLFTDGLLQAGALEKEEPIYFLQRLKT